jgi:hypothetical protein
MSSHIHDSEGHHVGDICTGTNNRYIARVHWKGEKKWRVVSKHKTYRAAVKAMAVAFGKDQFANKADVVMTADYYDPAQLCELVRR